MAPLRRVKLTELNAHLVCVLCSGYFVDATTIIECLHTFCKTCIVRYLQTSSFCPICEVQVHKTKPLLSLREDRTLQDVVFKLVPGLFHSEMKRRHGFIKEHPDAGGDKIEQSLRERRHFFHVDDQISLSLEYLATAPPLSHPHLNSHAIKPLKVNNGQQEKQKQGTTATDEKGLVTEGKGTKKECDSEDKEVNGVKVVHKRYLRCPAAVQVSHLEKFIRLKYSLTPQTHRVDIMHGGDCLVGELTLLDVVYMYKWMEDAPLRLMYTVTAKPQSRKRARVNCTQALAQPDADAPASKVQKIQNSSPEDKTKPPVPVSPPKRKAQDSSKDQVEVTAVEQVTGLGDEKAGKVVRDQPHPLTTPCSVSVSKLSSSSLKSAGTQIFMQSLPNTSFTDVTVNSSAAQFAGPTPARGRPALTTTTPATTTPRIALAHNPSPPVNPASNNSSVALPMGGPISSVPVSTSTTTTQTNVAISSVANVNMQVPQPLINGMAEGSRKPIHIPASQRNQMPQPIIPTKPRLGRPPNSSRINAANLRPPNPRLGDVRNTRPQMSATKKMLPGGLTGRGNQIVSASLNVQSDLKNANGPSEKTGAAKVPVKRSNEVLRETLQMTESNEGTKSLKVTTTAPSSPGSVQGNHYTTVAQPIPSSSTVLVTTPVSQGPKMTASYQGTQTLPSDKQVDQHSQVAPVNQRPGNQSGLRPSFQGAPRSTSQTMQRPAANQVSQRHPVPVAQQRPPISHVNQRVSVTQSSQISSGQHVNQRSHQVSSNSQGIQQSMNHATHHIQTGQVSQQPLGTQSLNPQMNNPTQRPVAPINQRNGSQRMPASSVSQRPSPVTSRTPSSPAPHRPPPQPVSTPIPNRPPGSPAPHQSPSSPAPHRPSSSPAPHRPSSSPAPHRPSSNPAPHRPSSNPAPHRPSSNPAPHRPSSNPVPQRPSSNPAPHRPSSSPAPHRPPSSPAPHRLPSIPAPHRPPSSPAPHRQPGNTTPHPNTTQTQPITVSTPPISSSPRSVPSPSTSQATPVNRESMYSVGTVNSSAGTNTSTSIPNGKPGGIKPGMNNVQSKTGPPPANTGSKTPTSKTPPATAKAPKSPGRGRTTSSSPTILSIAQSLANKKLQQRTTAPPTSTVNTTSAAHIATTQVTAHQGLTCTTPDTSVYPGNVASGLVSPALAAAAYMASAYADPSTALTDVTAMRNLITLSQTAACIREFNLAAMVNLKAAETLPRPPDPAPIDLSPTCKAAPQNPMTNGRPHTSVATSSAGTKTTGSHASKSPSKSSRPSTSASATTISPPTPEVTITKLPNAPAVTSTIGTGKNTFGSVKMGSTNTNTVSITKRPASNNRIAVAKSANASVRQIPNPSFLRHQSEVRNNNNISKSMPSTSNSSLVTKNHTSKHSGSGGRATGNSPLKETGPLPETSSILKIEHLTRSLAAPAAASHGIRHFDDR